MAEAVIFKLVGNISSVLASQAVEQAKSRIAPLMEVKDKISELKEHFAVMQGFLKDMDKKKRKNEATNAWIEQVRDISFQAEDILDEYTRLIQMRQTRDGICGSCIYETFHDVSHIHAWFSITSQLAKVDKTLQHDLPSKKKLFDIDIKTSSTDRRNAIDHEEQIRFEYLAERAHFIEEDEIVGFDEYTNLLMAYLKDDSNRVMLQRSMLSVWGMGGVGKTTLVARIYKKVKRVFDCCAWITVSSQSPNVYDLLKRIFTALCSERKEEVPHNMISGMSYKSLVETLQDYLKDRRYLIVLDDIWKRNDWDNMKDVFIDSKNGSRIVITTRERDVGLLADLRLELKPLGGDAAWSLFCKKAFCSDPGRRCPEELEHWGRKIVDKCGGLPLAIVTTGSFLSLKEKSEVIWEEVYENLILEITENKEFEQTMNILNLSFTDLPPYLVNCFLYFGLFSEDYSINRGTLVRLWVAEGFVKEWGRMTMEEVAEDYLNQLVHRSMIQVVFKDVALRIEGYKVHDLIRDLILSKYKKDQFCMLIHNDTIFPQGMTPTAGERYRYRHLSFGNCTSGKTNLQNIEKFVHLRSFLAFDEVPKAAFKLIGSFRLLRVLILQNSQIKKLPDEVFNLFCLRHFSLRGCDQIKKLPKSLGRLRNLQTLDVRGTGLLQYPNAIARLKDLRHIFLLKTGHTPCPPRVLSKLTALQTLKDLVIDEDPNIFDDLGCLEEMRSLTVTLVAFEYCARLCASLRKMKRLRKLNLTALVLQLDDLLPPPTNHLQKLCLWGKLIPNAMLPKWFDESNLRQLTMLDLAGSELTQDSLSIIGKLPNLLVMILMFQAFISEALHFHNGLFSKLQELSLGNLSHLKSVEIEKGSLTSLKLLHFQECSNLKMVPLGLEHLENLESLILNNMPRELTRRFDRTSASLRDQEYLRKLKHLQVILIDYSGD